MSLTESQQKILKIKGELGKIAISKVAEALTNLVIEKNKRYGDSALNPLKIFCKNDSATQIETRLDDKLNRIINSDKLRKNDVSDLMGYLILLCVANDWLDFSDLID